MKHNFTIILIILGTVFGGCQRKVDQSEVDLSVTEFAIQIRNGNSFLLDVRTPEEVITGKIKGAKVLNILGPEFEEQYMYLPKDKKLYVYCRSGNRSRKAVKFLKDKGYKSVYHLDGGMNAWKKEGMPVGDE